VSDKISLQSLTTTVKFGSDIEQLGVVMQDIEIIIRSWKDDEYRMSLSADEQQKLPENPAGVVVVSDTVLNNAADRLFGTLINFGRGSLC
jgi:mersacidin/lichenicidin family type 2 lantibiotic